MFYVNETGAEIIFRAIICQNYLKINIIFEPRSNPHSFYGNAVRKLLLNKIMFFTIDTPHVHIIFWICKECSCHILLS